jgi:hypothetical protein
MSEDIELKLLREIEELKSKVAKLEKKESIETYSFNQTKFSTLKKLVDIKREYNKDIFDKWFNYSKTLKDDDIEFLENLIDRVGFLVESFKEDDLKVKFIAPILNRVDFLLKEQEIRDFYHERLIYKTDNFIFDGFVDFMVAKGKTFRFIY